MPPSSPVSSVLSTLRTLSTLLAALHPTAPLWPPTANVKDGATYDFIVVGTGTAGSIIATRLSEIEDVSVLLIEARENSPLSSVVSGTFPLMSFSANDRKFKSEPADNIARSHMENTLKLTAGNMLGGFGALNHLIYDRGFPADYDKWAEATNDDSWNSKNIFKYFLKSEHLKDKNILDSEFAKYHGNKGTIGTKSEPHPSLARYLNAFKDVGYSVLHDTSSKLGYSNMIFMITEAGRQANTAQSHLINLAEKDKIKNLRIVKNTLVTKILFDDNNVATGVTALGGDGKEVTYKARKEVILSAGTFDSPKLLMLSGIGPKEDLEKFGIPVIADLPVGENYQDPPNLFIMESTQRLLPNTPPNLMTFPFPVINGFVALDKSQMYPDYQQTSFVMQDQLSFSILCSIVFSYSNALCDSILRETEGREMFIMQPTFLHPKSRGKISLRSTDPKDALIIKPGLLTDDDDVDMMIAIIEDSMKIENSAYFKDVGSKLVEVDLPECKQYTLRSRDYWRCYIQQMAISSFHYASTCSMGVVVDSGLKVKEVKNLRVIDASVMPNVPSGNIQMAVLAVAEKGANMIKETHGYITETYDDSTSNSLIDKV